MGTVMTPINLGSGKVSDPFLADGQPLDSLDPPKNIWNLTPNLENLASEPIFGCLPSRGSTCEVIQDYTNHHSIPMVVRGSMSWEKLEMGLTPLTMPKLVTFGYSYQLLVLNISYIAEPPSSKFTTPIYKFDSHPPPWSFLGELYKPTLPTIWGWAQHRPLRQVSVPEPSGRWCAAPQRPEVTQAARHGAVGAVQRRWR